MNKQEIERTIKYWKEFKEEIPELKESYPDAGLDKQEECVDMAIFALTQQLNNGWIPVSFETNPKKSDIYLVTFEEGGNRYVERFSYSDFIGWVMPIAWQDEGRIDNLIAWQPLPEPYKEAPDGQSRNVKPIFEYVLRIF